MRIKIKDLKKSLSEAAQKPPSEVIATSARAVVEAAHAEIETLLQRGFSHRAVAELLTANGVKISMASLQTYLRPPQSRTTNRPPVAADDQDMIAHFPPINSGEDFTHG